MAEEPIESYLAEERGNSRDVGGGIANERRMTLRNLFTHPRILRVMRSRRATSCPAGYYHGTTISSTTPCEPVGVGYFSEEGELTRRPCFPGTFSNVETAAECQECWPGSFTDTLAAASCAYCPSAFYTVETAATHCDPCNPFYYSGPGSDYAILLTPTLNGSPERSLYCLEPLVQPPAPTSPVVPATPEPTTAAPIPVPKSPAPVATTAPPSASTLTTPIPTTARPTSRPTLAPVTPIPTTEAPLATLQPTTPAPTLAPYSAAPSAFPTVLSTEATKALQDDDPTTVDWILSAAKPIMLPFLAMLAVIGFWAAIVAPRLGLCSKCCGRNKAGYRRNRRVAKQSAVVDDTEPLSSSFTLAPDHAREHSTPTPKPPPLRSPYEGFYGDDEVYDQFDEEEEVDEDLSFGVLGKPSSCGSNMSWNHDRDYTISSHMRENLHVANAHHDDDVSIGMSTSGATSVWSVPVSADVSSVSEGEKHTIFFDPESSDDDDEDNADDEQDFML